MIPAEVMYLLEQSPYCDILSLSLRQDGSFNVNVTITLDKSKFTNFFTCRNIGVMMIVELMITGELNLRARKVVVVCQMVARLG